MKSLMNSFFYLLSFLFVLVKPACSYAELTFLSYCFDSYQKTGQCPQRTCELKCAVNEQSKDCEDICMPLDCREIKVEDCPLQFCTVMVNCSGEKICHYKMMGEKAECGDLAYAGQDVNCCQGLVKRCGVQFLDGSCDMKGQDSVYNIPICIPCGDGICGQFEDGCNCPEDCGNEEPYAGFSFGEIEDTVQEKILINK